MLLVLTPPCSGGYFTELDFRNRSHVPEGVVSSLVTYPSNCVHHIFFFVTFEEDKCLCLVETLKVYEERTDPFCDSSEENRVYNHLLANMIPLPQVLLQDGLRRACKGRN